MLRLSKIFKYLDKSFTKLEKEDNTQQRLLVNLSKAFGVTASTDFLSTLNGEHEHVSELAWILNNELDYVKTCQTDELKRVLVNIFTMFNYNFKIDFFNGLLYSNNKEKDLFEELIDPIIGYVVNDFEFMFTCLDDRLEDRSFAGLTVFNRIQKRIDWAKFVVTLKNHISYLDNMDTYKDFYTAKGWEALCFIMAVYYIYITELDVARLNKKSLKLINTLYDNGCAELFKVNNIHPDALSEAFDFLRMIPDYKDKVFDHRAAYNEMLNAEASHSEEE